MNDLSRNIPQLHVNEFFDSIQGEGALTGYRTLFVRTQGCKVGCKWCDTKYTWRKGSKSTKMRVLDAYKTIKDIAHKKQWICFTGGEPLEQLSSVKWIIEKLYRNNYRKISIETSGLPQPDLLDLADLFLMNVFFSLSPKLESAIGKRFSYNDLLSMCKYWDAAIYVPFRLQYKFVIGSDSDLITIDQLLKDFKTDHYFFLQIENSKIKDKDFINNVLNLQKMEHFYKSRIVIQQHTILGVK